jgi:hypothetical protein
MCNCICKTFMHGTGAIEQHSGGGRTLKGRAPMARKAGAPISMSMATWMSPFTLSMPATSEYFTPAMGATCNMFARPPCW